VNLAAAQKVAVKAARAAGQVMRDNWHAPKKINAAEAHDIKLELDVRCQALIEKTLAAAFPRIPVLGEEGSTGDTTADYRWVIDPIDGTVNYAFGNPHAAVSIALQSKNDKWQAARHEKRGSRLSGSNLVTRNAPHISILGLIYDPFTDELWTTTIGQPTRLNGRVVRVSDRSKVEDAIVAIGFSKSKENIAKSLPHVIRIARRARKIRILGSAALELTYVACGRLDAYIERTINLWDVAAPAGKMRMCADNGRLRKKLQLGSLLKPG